MPRLSEVPVEERYTGELKHLEYRDFWMDPRGNIAVVGMWEHARWAYQHFEVSERELILAGWVQKTGRSWMREKLNQTQLDRIYDWHVACGRKFDIERWPLELV